AARTLENSTGIDSWLLVHASRVVAASDSPLDPVSPEAASSFLYRAILTLKGVAAVHIDSCALLAASLGTLDRVFIPIGTLRDLILQTAMERPDLARLSRGHAGTRPEFVTFDMKKLESFGVNVL